MRILALETSTHRGSVALLEDEAVRAHVFHEEPNRHAERMLGLVQEAFGQAEWTPAQLDRVAAGVGPGAFTGIRVGLSIAAGLVVALGVEGLGIGSLRALAQGIEENDRRLRVVLRDARRDEFFLAAYEPDGTEVVAPEAVPQEGIAGEVRRRFEGREFVTVGDVAGDLPHVSCLKSDAPDAVAIARLAALDDPATAALRPHYVRGANAVRPKLPPSPLDLPRT